MNGGILVSIAKRRHIISTLFLMFAAAMTFSLVATPLAKAAKYGPIGSPGLSWRDDFVFNGRDGGSNPYPEMISFTCNNPDSGKPFSADAKNTIREISNNSVTVFTGNFNAEDVFGDINLGDSEEAFKEQPNYGMPGGPVGLKKYLRGENKLLRTSIISDRIGRTDLGDATNLAGEVAGGIASAVTAPAQQAWGFVEGTGNLVTRDFDSALSDYGDIGSNMPGLKAAKAWQNIYGASSRLTSNKKATPKSAWTIFDDRSLNSNRKNSLDHGGGFYVWAQADGKTAYVDKDGKTEDVWDELGAYNDTFKLSPQEGKSIAKMINAKAQTPIQAFMGVPAGCPMADLDTAENLGLNDLFSSLEGTLARLILAIPSMIVDAVYGLVYPQAWKYAFYTPHTERGDTIFDMSTTCTPGSSSNSCKGYQELGYTTPRIDGASAKERPMFLKLTSMIQWLLSGTYFLILFTSAVLFIFRGTRGQTLQLMRVGPRLALTLMFTFILPFLMGAVITLSNLTIVSILEFGNKGAGTNLAEANILTSQIGAWFSDDPNGIAYPVVKFATGLAATIAAVMVLASAYIRQILLIILVVTAPIAVFCLIVDSWRPQFKRWLRVFFVVTLFPIVLGVILKIGMFINPIFNIRSEKAAENFGQGDAVTAFVMLIIMFWAMARAVKMAQGMIGNPGGGALGAAGGMLGQLGQGLKANRWTAPLGMAMGAAGYGLGRASQAPTDMKAALIPGGRGSMGAGGGMFGGAAGALGPGGSGAPGMPGGRLVNAVNEKFTKFAENGQARKAERKAMRGITRKAKREDFWAGDRKKFGFIPSPRGVARGITGHITNHMPDAVRGKDGSLRRKLFVGANARAQGRMTSISEGEAQQKIAARQRLAASLADLHPDWSNRKIQQEITNQLGVAPVNRGNGWKQFKTQAQHQEHQRRNSIEAIMATMEAKTGHRPDVYRRGTRPDGGGGHIETLSRGVDYDKFKDTAAALGLQIMPGSREDFTGEIAETMIFEKDIEMFGRRR